MQRQHRLSAKNQVWLGLSSLELMAYFWRYLEKNYCWNLLANELMLAFKSYIETINKKSPFHFISFSHFYDFLAEKELASLVKTPLLEKNKECDFFKRWIKESTPALPAEVWLHILHFLPIKERINAREVCHFFYSHLPTYRQKKLLHTDDCFKFLLRLPNDLVGIVTRVNDKGFQFFVNMTLTIIQPLTGKVIGIKAFPFRAIKQILVLDNGELKVEGTAFLDCEEDGFRYKKYFFGWFIYCTQSSEVKPCTPPLKAMPFFFKAQNQSYDIILNPVIIEYEREKKRIYPAPLPPIIKNEQKAYLSTSSLFISDEYHIYVYLLPKKMKYWNLSIKDWHWGTYVSLIKAPLAMEKSLEKETSNALRN